MSEEFNEKLTLGLPAATPFKPQEMFSRYDHFQCTGFGYPKANDVGQWHVGYKKFERELEDLMRKYKVVQCGASIFAKL